MTLLVIERRYEDIQAQRIKGLVSRRERWLSEFHQLLNEKREAIEGMRQNLPKRPCINAENEMFGRCFDCEKTKGFNTALDDVLSILKE